MSRARLAFFATLGLSLAPWLSCLTAAGAEESAPIVVEIAGSLGYLDEEALRKAIGAELRTQALPSGSKSTSSRGTLLLGLDRASGELRMTYRPRAGSVLVRKLKLPAERDAQVTTIALLAGNLARDEAAELLAALARPSASASSSLALAGPPPSSSSAPVASAPVSSASASASATGSSPIPPGAPVASASASASTAEEPPPPAPPASAPAPPRASPPCARRQERGEPVVVQLVPGVGYPAEASSSRTGLSLSLVLGSVGELREGVQLGAMLTRVEGDSSWVTAGAVGSLVGGRIQGAALGGVFQLGECDAQGYLGAGVFSAQRGAIQGAQGAGAVAVAGGEVKGFQGAGLVSVARGKVTGFQGSGLVSVAQGGVEGFQGAGLVNLAGDVEGMQLGLVNVGGKVKGVQLGLVNLARHMDGYPLGLFSYAENTRLQPVLWVSPRPRYNLGLKMATGHAYQIVSAGVSEQGDRPLYGLAYTLGLHFPLDNFFVDGDIGYHWVFPTLHLDTSGSSPRWKDEHAYLVKARALGGIQLWRRLALFAGGGIALSLGELAQEKAPRVGNEWTFGVQF